MAQTIPQWQAKVIKWVPSWAQIDRPDESALVTTAVLYAAAALFQQIEQDMSDHQQATFLLDASAPILDLEGKERGILRNADETDPLYKGRIQRVTSQSDEPDIKAAVDNILLRPGCKIEEAPSHFCSRQSTFCSRDNYTLGYLRNAFMVIVPGQTHPAYSFASRNYSSRSTFCGSSDITPTDLASVITLVNQMKAFGVLWGLVESTKTVVV